MRVGNITNEPHEIPKIIEDGTKYVNSLGRFFSYMNGKKERLSEHNIKDLVSIMEQAYIYKSNLELSKKKCPAHYR